MAKKFISKENYEKIWTKEKAYFVAQEQGKGLSSYDYDCAAKEKVDALKTVATSGSYADLTNKPTIPAAVYPTDLPPIMDGTASAGSSLDFARGNHVHPSDTSRVPVTRKVNNKALSEDITLTASDLSAIPASAKGTANGVATLGADGLVPSAQLPSYVDDVLEGYLYNAKFYQESAHTTEMQGESGKIYVDITNAAEPISYRYSGSVYSKIVSNDAVALTDAEIDAIMV